MKWILLFCFACTTLWAVQDFHKKIWTPNERTFSGVLLALIVLAEIISFTHPKTMLASYLMAFCMIAALVVVIAETCFDFRYGHQLKIKSKHK